MTGRRSHIADSGELTVTQSELADYLGVVPNSVSRFAAQDGMPKAERGRYVLRDCVQWYVLKLRQRALERPGDLVEERRKLIVSQREGQELQNAADRAAMLNADLVKEALHHLVGLIGARLDEIPAKVVPQIAKLRDAAAISRVVSDAAHDARRLASQDIAAFAASLADGS